MEFKNIISGPAPIHRILHYIQLAGDNKLYHKNGNRDTKLKDNIAYAWTSEFMVGLSLLEKQKTNLKIEKLILTNEGETLYEIIKNESFEEEINNDEIVRKLTNEGYNIFKNIFCNSIVFYELINYVISNNINNCWIEKTDFQNQFYLYEFNKFDGTKRKSKDFRSTSTTTGGNRVPALLNLCEFFDYMSLSKKEILFKFNENEQGFNSSLDDTIVVPNNYNDLIVKFGESGTIIQKVEVRNPLVQQKFRNKLLTQQNCCCLCAINKPQLLIASHIKPSSVSNVLEKLDVSNGFLMCPNHDKLFDSFLISFNSSNYRIMISDEITVEERKIFGLTEDFTLPNELHSTERSSFLEFHNQKFNKINQNV